MAFQADGSGIIEITGFTPSGNFTIEFPPFIYTLPGNKLMANSSGPASVEIFSEGRIKVKFGSSEEYIVTVPGLTEGDTVSDLVINRVSGSGTISAGGASQAFTSSTALILNTIFGTSGGSYNYRGKFESGALVLSGGTGAASYDFTAESGTTLIDTTGTQTTGVLSGFTTGGFVANGAVVIPETTTVTFDIPEDLIDLTGVRYAVMPDDLSSVLINGTLDTSATTVEIDLDGIAGLSDGDVLQMYATDKTSSNPTTAVTLWDESTVVVAGG